MYELPMDTPDDGIRRLPTNHSVTSTLDRLEALLKEINIKIFARIDFSADAASAGLAMAPEQQLIFGSPRAGTPLMTARATSALDLPLRAICWQDAEGNRWLAYNDPAYMVKRHRLPPELEKNLAAVIPLLERAAKSD